MKKNSRYRFSVTRMTALQPM